MCGHARVGETLDVCARIGFFCRYDEAFCDFRILQLFCNYLVLYDDICANEKLYRDETGVIYSYVNLISLY